MQKIIADSGFASRRKAEEFIRRGQVYVNGKKVSLGAKASDRDEIRVGNKRIKTVNDTGVEILLLNKPVGYITTRNDPKGRKTVFQLLPKPDAGRWISIGRLDINTSGLLLFTTQGQLANQFMHPSKALEREYSCRIYGKINDNIIKQLKDGIKLKNEKGVSRFYSLNVLKSSGKNHWVNVVLKQGRYREVRRLWQAVGCQVNRLIRIRYGPIALPKDLAPGECQKLSPARCQTLTRELGDK